MKYQSCAEKLDKPLNLNLSPMRGAFERTMNLLKTCEKSSVDFILGLRHFLYLIRECTPEEQDLVDEYFVRLVRLIKHEGTIH